MHLWDELRARLAAEKHAKDRGYAAGAFSLNVPGGRCETCKGQGYETVEMQFLADVTFSCPDCAGRRFVGDVLEVRHRGKNAAELLELTANELLGVFAEDKRVVSCVRPLVEVGLGYLKLGQPLNTLSGGESQRLKLAEALSRAPKGSFIVLDEPTAGLHADDVTPLLEVLEALAHRGDTVVVVEHDMRVAARADHVIDLGPGAGAEGGHVMAAGTPEQVAKAKRSLTAPYLRAALAMPVLAADTAAKKKVAKERRASDLARDAEDDGCIRVEGATEHNLKNVSVSVPREKLVVVTGPSGSGKSTLAFDVIFAEGQRRFLETLTPYARQYLPQLPRPEVHRVVGVPPSVSLEQRTTRGGANSTVATVTEIAHYLRLMWARAGTLHCPKCQVPIAPRNAAQIAEDLLRTHAVTAKTSVAAPVVRGRKGHYRELFEKARKDGLTQAIVDGTLTEITAGMKLDRFKEHDVELVLGEARLGATAFVELLDRAFQKGDGAAHIVLGKESLFVSSKRSCPSCGAGYPELDPRFFSFNTRQGGCEPCEGRGVIVEVKGRGKNARDVTRPCEACGSSRLSPLARSVTVDGHPITDILSLSVSDARARVAQLTLDERASVIAHAPLAELKRRFAFLEEVGLGYLGLDRSADTLSGGEMQRVRLAAQLGSGLTGVLYVLDEPTIGLHPRDTGRLVRAMRALVDRGNSILVVEHDADTIRAADHVIDVGPGGGRRGGHIVAEGTPSEIVKNPKSITGPALVRTPPVPSERRPTAKAKWLTLEGAKQHNLKDVNLRIPLGRLVSVTGVSGSGKSTLVRDVLLRAVRKELGLVTEEPGTYTRLRGLDGVTRAIEMDQTPIGRTPRSVPATYVGIWDELRKLIAQSPDSRARGYTASRFSFNVSGGRCEACEGQGALTVEMSFLPEALVICETCRGARFGEETLSVKFHDMSAGEILDLDVDDAVVRFAPVSKVAAPLSLLQDLGLGYLKLGQPSNTLSGGEAQRLKLVAELGATQMTGSLYVMDEPTTGLHRDDVGRLIGVLNRLVDRGDTVVVIEHHPDVIMASDWVVDLGPEGGKGGGQIIAEGTPEQIMAVKQSHTGAALRSLLEVGSNAGAKKKAQPRRTAPSSSLRSM
jgi:excinuclease ABC subunit A